MLVTSRPQASFCGLVSESCTMVEMYIINAEASHGPVHPLTAGCLDLPERSSTANSDLVLSKRSICIFTRVPLPHLGAVTTPLDESTTLTVHPLDHYIAPADQLPAVRPVESRVSVEG